SALYLKASDQKVYKTDADFDDERIHSFVGFAKESGVLNDVKQVWVSGKATGMSGLTPGSKYYLSGTPGAISVTPGAYKKHVGIAVSATELFIEKYSELAGYTAPARALDTNYQNGNKWRMVMATVNFNCDPDEYSLAEGKIGSSSPAGTVIAKVRLFLSTVADYIVTESELVFLVPPLYYYQIVTSGTGSTTLLHWYEIDLNW
ncbi:unnamed protein product, partial [marine sediment metagenome]